MNKSIADSETLKTYLEKYKPLMYENTLYDMNRDNFVYFSDWIDADNMIMGYVNTKTGEITARTYEATNTYKLDVNQFYENDDVTEQKILNAAIRPYHRYNKGE